MLPNIIPSIINNNNSNSSTVEVTYTENKAIIALVRNFNFTHLVNVRRDILQYVEGLISIGNEQPTISVDLIESSCSYDVSLHLNGILTDASRMGCLVEFNVISEFDPDLAILLLNEHVTKITWDYSSYISFVSLKDTARKMQERKLSGFGEYFIPKATNDIRELLNVDLSDISNFNDIYSGDEIIGLLKSPAKEKSILLK